MPQPTASGSWDHRLRDRLSDVLQGRPIATHRGSAIRRSRSASQASGSAIRRSRIGRRPRDRHATLAIRVQPWIGHPALADRPSGSRDPRLRPSATGRSQGSAVSAATAEDEPTLGRALGFVAGGAHEGVLRGERAGRVGRAQVAREGEGLAAAAAEVDVAPIAALARLGHPRVAAVGAERLAVGPDVAQRAACAPSRTSRGSDRAPRGRAAPRRRARRPRSDGPSRPCRRAVDRRASRAGRRRPASALVPAARLGGDGPGALERTPRSARARRGSRAPTTRAARSRARGDRRPDARPSRRSRRRGRCSRGAGPR